MRKRLMTVARGVVGKEPNYVYYWLKFVVGFSFGLISPVYALLLFGNGLNAFQVGLVNLVFVLGNILFYIPAGALADAWGRKKAFLVSTIFNSVSFWIYAFAKTWPFFMLAEGLAAIGFVLMVGVLEAWVVDAWKERSVAEEYGFLFSRAEISGSLASMIGGFLGGFLASFYLQLPFLIGAISNLLVLPMAWLLMEEEKIEKKINWRAIITQSMGLAKEGTKEGLKNKLFFNVALSSGLVMIGYKVIDMYWSKRFVDLGGGKVSLAGYIWVLMTLFMIIGNVILKKWTDRKNDYLTGFLLIGLWAALMIFLSLVFKNFYLSVGTFLFYEFSRGTSRAALFGFLNKIIPSDKRATLLAFCNMVVWIGAAVSLLTLGWVAKRFSIDMAWLGATVVFLLALIPILRLKKVC